MVLLLLGWPFLRPCLLPLHFGASLLFLSTARRATRLPTICLPLHSSRHDHRPPHIRTRIHTPAQLLHSILQATRLLAPIRASAMSLSAKYQAFLASPSAGALADNASLHYITTLTSIHDAGAIMKHLAVQDKLLKKTEQKVLSKIEGANGLSVDVETTIEFSSGGGAYLPGLDDNFVADRIVTFPMVREGACNPGDLC